MSDLFGNPEDRFSRVMAHLETEWGCTLFQLHAPTLFSHLHKADFHITWLI